MDNSFNNGLSHLLQIDIDMFMVEEVRDKIREFLIDNCSGNFFVLYGPSSVISNDGKYITMDRSYLFIFFEKEQDKILFKLKWM